MMSKALIGEFALSDVAWCKPNAAKPQPADKFGYNIGDIVSFIVPQNGDKVWLFSERYDEIADKEFWAVYEPLNGIDTDYPQQLDEVRVVRCERISQFENFTDWKKKPLEHRGIFQVRCLEVLNLAQIPQRLPVDQNFKLDLNNQWEPIQEVIERPQITYYTGCNQGAIWEYIATNSQPRRLILCRLFVSTGDNWIICNCPFELIEKSE